MYHFRYWTQDELDDLRRMWTQGLTAPQIGRVLKRTPNSVRNQALSIGLPRRKDGAPRKPRKPAKAARMVQPLNGRFDSSKVLLFLIDHWGKAA